MAYTIVERQPLQFEDVCGYAGTPWRITREEWDGLCEVDWACHDKTFRQARFTMEQGFCLVRDMRWEQSEYAEFFEIRLRNTRSSKTFGPYVGDAYRSGHRARDKALAYLIEHGAVEIIDTTSPDVNKG